MKCFEIQTAFDSYLDGDLTPKESKIIETHLNSCAACKQDFDDAIQVRKVLNELPVVEPDTGFEQRVLAEVRRQYEGKDNSLYAKGFATALVASLMLWFAGTVYFKFDGQTFNANKVSTVNITMNKVQTVRLMLDSPNDIKQVTLSLGLPENIRLKGHESEQRLEWQTSLTRGENILALPVKAIADGQGDMVARISYGSTVKQFEVRFKTTTGSVRDGAHNQTDTDGNIFSI